MLIKNSGTGPFKAKQGHFLWGVYRVMYSIGMLGALMTLESFGREFPFWIAPLNTFILLGFFLYLSFSEIKSAEEM